MDNYATHKTAAVKAWLARRPHWHVHLTPTSASWINQVERWFAELTRKQLQRGVHTSTRQLEADIRAFIEKHNEDPKPFRWTKSADDILAAVKRFPAYPRHSAWEGLCSWYVPDEGGYGYGVQGCIAGARVERRGVSRSLRAEEQCRSACPGCAGRTASSAPPAAIAGIVCWRARSLYQCYRCKKQTSSTAGTIFHATKLPLTLWFAAVHLIVTAKNGISSVELGRRLGVKQPTAWTMKHKIMAVMARREADTPLSGRVEMDDAYLGGARAGGKRGRGAPGKTPFVAAVSTSPEGRPRKVKLVPVKGFRKREIARGAKRWLAPGSEVLTDGLRCWNALDGVVGSHRAIRTGSGRQAARMAPFKWVNTTLGNIKSAITGTYPKLGPDHAQRYLASFAWRYNRRLPAQHHDPALRSQRRTNPTHPIPSAHRWMTFMDKQERFCLRVDQNLCHELRFG